MIPIDRTTPTAEPQTSRRTFVHGAATAMAMVAIPPGGAVLEGRTGGPFTDERIAVFLHGFELALAALYDVAAPQLEPEPARLLAGFGAHHRRHAEAFAAIADDGARAEPNTTFLAEVGPEVERAAAAGGREILELARRLEDQAAHTHAFALTVLRAMRPAAVAATVLPVEADHATTLGSALGRSPAEQFGTGAFEAVTVGSALAAGAALDPARYG